MDAARRAIERDGLIGLGDMVTGSVKRVWDQAGIKPGDEVIAMRSAQPGDPLLYYDRGYRSLGD